MRPKIYYRHTVFVFLCKDINSKLLQFELKFQLCNRTMFPAAWVVFKTYLSHNMRMKMPFKDNIFVFLLSKISTLWLDRLVAWMNSELWYRRLCQVFLKLFSSSLADSSDSFMLRILINCVHWSRVVKY